MSRETVILTPAMASFETIIAFARNGMCVCVDTLPGEHLLKLPLKALHSDSVISAWLPDWMLTLMRNGTVQELSILNACIACLQLAAVIFNLAGAAALPLALTEYRRLRLIESRLALKSRSRIAEVGASLAVKRAASKVAFALVRLLLGPSFALLALYSLRLASQRLLEWSLLLMQIALTIALVAMWRELSDRRIKAANASAVAESPSNDDPGMLVALDDISSDSQALGTLFLKASAKPHRVLCIFGLCHRRTTLIKFASAVMLGSRSCANWSTKIRLTCMPLRNGNVRQSPSTHAFLCSM